MKIILANPRGFCAGVDRAISIVELALEIHGAPIYVRHEVVHNRFVVNGLRDRGAIFVEELSEVPDGAIVIFSAHGVSQAVRQEAKDRNLKVFDATCPLVTKVHMQVARASRKGTKAILIGHKGHPEVEGTMGQYSNEDGGIFLIEKVEDIARLPMQDNDDLTFMTQTTLSLDDTAETIAALKEKYPAIQGPHKNDICYATTNRQEAVRELAKLSDLVLVVGSKNSSNSNRLAELASRMGIKSQLLDDPSDIQDDWFNDVKTIGITAGASAPEELVQSIISRLKEFGADTIEELQGLEENMFFEVPKELRIKEVN
ncbi:4-hydroxy-3-methylbut-2-enyl diphosphate reductase [Haemophilus influenzae]|jgi:4-hydroxy-3-methylbut-2-enyl diphosphate reductase|uniref:4-hydroxy-3-methylbut-2-enyl diphosphate reductase n=2 Tax=Haemophilus influenzae TaxID=727 RepID=ISPH_HAEI8|nr:MULTISPECIES: 4-hydroxy-3-methylbut-2-enyl diphosphate reductase [Haemophilus]Q4QLQ5.1 RecName: Full=4-hydroxy-3-methylbut-2-enyl diphosphate reductase; Short=HMBPP reductase [Haemophilus influenzae 86-028NP]EDK09505.1 4-hydroxy-3-methylbut-2-enyl diphosphate reductase [Haemophilus influenzae PittHH]AAX88042.1 4-hydroxy-3-methylbut-2-enyl diphosphate reductase [Haemophilus influenzae 86-028NP]AIT68309.1 4-hydroxy-3-methylbut-2-enyl diphosphate reductase [Haemophilus influenzae]AJO91072.1 4-